MKEKKTKESMSAHTRRTQKRRRAMVDEL